MEKTIVKGHIVLHEDDANPAIRYMTYELNDAQVKVFFDQAFAHGSAEFEDHMGTRFKLIYKNHEYELVRVS